MTESSGEKPSGKRPSGETQSGEMGAANQPSDATQRGPRIVVVGIGGAGGNAVNNMIQSDLPGVQFVVANTDSQALAQSLCACKIQVGASMTRGLGAGSRPEIGRAAAEETLPEIMAELEGAHMVFITAGMGGGTGTGAAPVIARAAREAGILTVGVVTKPFHFEGTRRMSLAELGIADLAQYVDTLIVIPNQNLFRIANEKTTFADAFKMADNVLHSGVRGVTDLIVTPGMINLDFADIRAVMTEMGKAIMGTGEAEGDNRALAAAEAAIANPLLDDLSMKGAHGVLINITGGMDLTLFEIDQAANRIREEVDADANIIFGSTFDDTMAGRMRVSLFAAGIDVEEQGRRPAGDSKRPIVSLYSDRVQTQWTPRSGRDIAAAVIEEATSKADAQSHRGGDAQSNRGGDAQSNRGGEAEPAEAPAAPDADPAEDNLETPEISETPETPRAAAPRPSPAPVFPFRARNRDRTARGEPDGVETAGTSAETATLFRPSTDAPEADEDDTTAPPASDQADDATVAPEPTRPELVLASPFQTETSEADHGAATASETAPSRRKRQNSFFSWIAGGGGASAEELFKKAERLYHGQGVAKNPSQAFRTYMRAAELDHAAAQNRVGWMYEKGEGTETDHVEAVRWYRKAAEQGYVNAMNDLGYMYRQGWGAPQSYEEALAWFGRAAAKYDSYAEYNMGQMYENGWGVPRDMDEAIRWFRRAAARGHEWAAKRLEELDVTT